MSRIQLQVLEQIEDELKRRGPSLVKIEGELTNEDSLKHIEKKKMDIRKKQSPAMYCNIYYRGQANSSYALLPGVLRETYQHGREDNWEHKYYQNIKTKCPDYFVGKGHLEQLVIMQHYGCPTRLLDVTSNALVALFFACYSDDEQEQINTNGKVFVFSPYEDEVLSFDSDRALMLACLPKMTGPEKEKIYQDAVKRICEGKELSKSVSNSVERLYHEIKLEAPDFERRINPLDLLTPYFVQPLNDNARINRQSGAFIICGLFQHSRDVSKTLSRMVGLEIEISNKERILEELENVGISEATLFPEIENVAHYYKKKQTLYMMDGSIPPKLG